MYISSINIQNNNNFRGFFKNNKTYERLLEEADKKTIQEFNKIKSIAEKNNDDLKFIFEPEEITSKTSYIDLVVKNSQMKTRNLLKTVYLFRGNGNNTKLENPLENFLPKLKDIYHNIES